MAYMYQSYTSPLFLSMLAPRIYPGICGHVCRSCRVQYIISARVGLGCLIRSRWASLRSAQAVDSYFLYLLSNIDHSLILCSKRQFSPAHLSLVISHLYLQAAFFWYIKLWFQAYLWWWLNYLCPSTPWEILPSTLSSFWVWTTWWTTGFNKISVEARGHK